MMCWQAPGDRPARSGLFSFTTKRTAPAQRRSTRTAPARVTTGWVRSILPFGDYSGNLGLSVGAGLQWTRLGYGYAPFASRLALRGEYAIGEGFAVETKGEFHRRGSATYLTASARASQIERVRFHGFGNQSEPAPAGERQRFIVSQDQLTADVLLHRTFGADGALHLALGPSFGFTRPDTVPGSPLAMVGRSEAAGFGNEQFGQFGARALVELEQRDNPTFPRRGMYAEVNAAAFPTVWGDAGAFGSASAEGRVYLPFGRAAYGPTLALRAGGERVWGDFPVQEAAFLGSRSTLRGFARERFAGDASVFAGAELRAKLFDAKLITRGRLGALALADAGRVWFDGESHGGFHTGIGGGLWFATLNRPYVVTATAVRGDEERSPKLYLGAGLPF